MLASRLAVLAASLAGFGPQHSGWTIVVAGACLLAHVVLEAKEGGAKPAIVIAMAGTLFGLTLGGIVPVSVGVLASVAFSFIVRPRVGNSPVILAILLIASTSGFLTLGSTLHGFIDYAHLVLPSVVPLVLLALAGRRESFFALSGIIVVFAFSASALWANTSVEPAAFVIAIAVSVAYSCALSTKSSTLTTRSSIAVIGGLLATWSALHTTRPSVVQFWLPTNAQAYEAQFYQNYQDVLHLAGIGSHRVSSAKEVLPKALVLMPWTTEAAQTNSFLNDLLAGRQPAHVVVAAEHTNYQGHAEVLNALIRNARINNNTTVPPGNLDWMGHMRTSSLMQFPPRAAFNRGASLTPTGFDARVLLQADAIFADAGLGEPLWVGDFVQSPRDHRGATVMALNTRLNDVVSGTIIGDGSFLIDRQVIANPRGLAHIVALATGIPSAVLDVLLVAVAITLLIQPLLNASAYFWVQLVLCAGVLGGASLTAYAYQWFRSDTRPIEAGRFSGYDERSFNTALVTLAPALNAAKASVFRHQLFLQPERLGTTTGPELHFGHAGPGFHYPNVQIKDCWRAGAIEIQGIRIMDGQGCSVSGHVRPIVRAGKDTTVFELLDRPGVYVFLDRAFLARNAGPKNEELISRLLRTKTPPKTPDH